MVFKTGLVSLFLLLTLWGCGNRRAPTGGPADTEKPTIVSLLPEQYSDLRNENIELTFSKPIDRSSVVSGEGGVYIYPPISEKRFRWTDNILSIEINEELEQNRNYYITVSQQIRDLRRNNLDRDYHFVYHTGELHNHRLYGSISYELEEDIGSPVLINLFSADTLLVLRREVSGENYRIDNLSEQDYLLRAFVDKNRNRRFDLRNEPFFEEHFTVSANKTIDINLKYFDETEPELLRITAEHSRLLYLTFNKAIESFSSAEISVKDSLEQAVEIIDYDISRERITLVTAPLDTLSYSLRLTNVEDFRGNIASELIREFNGKTEADSLAPKVILTVPRNGAVVDSYRPDLELTFSKFIRPNLISAELINTITRDTMPLEIRTKTAFMVHIRPTQSLQGRVPYRLIIKKETTDIFGNRLEEDFTLQFLPLIVE